MQVEPLVIPDIKIFTPRKFGDHRGFFSEVFSRREMVKAGIEHDFVQDNHSHSRDRGVLRGLHFQIPPFAQAKLIRVVRGAILDIAVDIRRDSPTFGEHVVAEISAENFRQIYIPVGFAHGFVTLVPDTEVMYKVSNYYSAAHDRGILWNDPALGIDWGITAEAAVLSDKDTRHPRLEDTTDLF